MSIKIDRLQQLLEYLKMLMPGHGHLNPNSRKNKDGQPDMIGYLKLPDGEIVKLSAWLIQNKNDETALSLSISDYSVDSVGGDIVEGKK
jgi:hypothetical protein